MARKQVKTTQIILIFPQKTYRLRNKCSGMLSINGLTKFSSVLPNQGRNVLHDTLIDQDMEIFLELKWNGYRPKLYPIKTAGYWNRLLQAVCLAIWGFHDISADLKDGLRTATNDDNFKTRWQTKRQKTNRGHTQAEWDDEWGRVLQRTESSDGLWEDIHVFVLAQMLYRPIVVLSDDEQLAGIYLPLDQHPDDCAKTPIVLAYTGYFVPLVTMEPAKDETNLSGVPLVSRGSTQPVIQFLRPEEEPESVALLHRYMEVTSVPDVGVWIPAAKLNPIKLDPAIDLIDKYCKSCDEEDKEHTPGDSYTCQVEMCNSEPRHQPSFVLCDVTNNEMPICMGPMCGARSEAACNGLCRNCHDILLSRRTPSPAGSSTEITSDIVRELCNNSGVLREWKMIMRCLGLDESEIAAIEYNYQKDGLKEIVFKAFEKLMISREATTMVELHSALRESNINNMKFHDHSSTMDYQQENI